MSSLQVFGPDAVLIFHPRPVDLAHLIRDQVKIKITDIIPAEDSLLVRTEPVQVGLLLEDLTRLIDEPAPSSAPHAPDGRQITFDVTYRGHDLEWIAEQSGMSIEQVVALHSQAVYRVAFCGFAPGFGYLTGLPKALHLPRRSEPRIIVDAGTVAIASHYAAVYPRSSPGGWHILGSTTATLFDPLKADPSLLVPGHSVRFTPVRESLIVTSTEKAVTTGASTFTSDKSDAAIEVLAAGASTIAIDQGRSGYGHIAVSRSGAWSRRDFDLAQRLVGNQHHAVGLETVGAGLRLYFLRAATIAVTGASGSLTLTQDHHTRSVDADSPVHVPAHATLTLGPLRSGLRRWLAIRGGFQFTPHLGSSSTDVLSGLGPEPVRNGDQLRIAADHAAEPNTDYVPTPAGAELSCEVIPGPDAALAGRDFPLWAIERQFIVSSHSNRVGVRLIGEPLLVSPADHQPSRPLIMGAVQLPPSGQPIVMGPDHPVTGGYPVIAWLTNPAAPAQWVPGSTITFHLGAPFRQ